MEWQHTLDDHTFDLFTEEGGGGEKGGVAGETIHFHIMYTADPWFSWRDLSNMKNNGLIRPFMTVSGWAQFRNECEERIAQNFATVSAH